MFGIFDKYFRLLNQKIDDFNATVINLRSANAKLDAEVEYQMERFKILNGNVEVYKREIKKLQEQKERQAALVAKHESTISKLTEVHFNAYF